MEEFEIIDWSETELGQKIKPVLLSVLPDWKFDVLHPGRQYYHTFLATKGEEKKIALVSMIDFTVSVEGLPGRAK